MHIYNIPLHYSIAETLKTFIINNKQASNLPYLIITPNKKAKEYCYNFIKDCENKINNKIYLVSISEPKEILKVLLELINNNYKEEISNLLNATIINENIKNFLLSNLLITSGFSINLKSSLHLAKEISNLLDILESENISVSQLENITTPSIFSENILKYLKSLHPNWSKTLKKLNLENPITYKTKVLNLISKIINSNATNCNIILLAIDNYSKHSIQLFNSVANYIYGSVIFNGIDYFITDEAWNKITYTHPQYVHKQLLHKLKITRDKVKCFSKLLNTRIFDNEYNNKINYNSDLFPRIFDTLPYKLPTNNNNNKYNHLTYIETSNEEEEAKAIFNTIVSTLENNPKAIITIVTINIDLSKRITFYLNNNNILWDQSFGIELTRTAVCKFFTLISTIDINNINFINLLSILKNPLSKFSNNLYYIELIDLYLARSTQHYFKLSEYLNLLTELFKCNILTQDEYNNIKNILTYIIDAFQTFPNKANDYINFKNTLDIHITLAEKLSSESIISNFKIWENTSGESLKEVLQEIKIETEYLTKITLEEYNQILLELLKQNNVRQPINKNTKVYICGILQAQYINEKSHIIIADFNEKSFPSLPKKEFSYINTILQKLNLSTKYDNIGKEALIFNKLCYFSKVYLTRSTKQQNLITTPSRFLTKLINTFKNNNIDLKNLKFNINKKQTEFITTNISQSIAVNPPVKYRPTTISATAIEKLLQNPYKYFIEYILKLKCLPGINTKFKNCTTGILFHEVFNTFFNIYKNNLKTLNKTAIRNHIVNIANAKFSIYKEKYLNASLSYYIFEYFSEDIAENIYNIVQKNTNINNEIKREIQASNNHLTILGRADCLALNTEQATIIDFKTGNIEIKKQDILDFRKQLIILAYIFNNSSLLKPNSKVNNLEYWIIPNNLKNKFEVKSLSKILDENLENFIEKDFAIINEKLFQYLCTETPFKYNHKYIENIKEYIHFSRIDITKI